MRLSFSALETYKQCPLKFKFREIDKIKVPQTKERFFGSVIHDVLRMLHDTNRLVPPTEEEMLQYFGQKWKPEVFVDKQEEPIAFSLGVKILKNYYAKNYPGQFQIVDLEARFEAPISDGAETHIIIGIIDRIDKLEDGSFEIIDYKTSKRMPGQKIVDNNLQLVVYHLGAANRWPTILNGGRPVKLSLYYLQHGEKLSTFRAAKQLEEAKEKILLTIDKIKVDISSGKFEALPGPLCDWCSYQKYCPLFKHKFKEKTPADDEIKRLAEEYFALKEQSDKNNKRLAEIKSIIGRYYDEKGVERIFSDSGYLTRSSKKTFIYDAGLLRDVLEPIGRWKEVLTIDNSKLKNVIVSLSAVKKRLIEGAKKVGKETKSIMATKK
ncbi:MAG: hypothetical protein COT61_04695 [Candidatus Portnoybacteria bacterium CG09_land_8_20_14_0_10_44_13]|uniref:PD-(D/E)XK endonuclease-like domain-containing protein n=5 Tax=Candidatus Portnoyibacteriota TaxID=1817913 RepID=A0A2H0KQZ8_9BACT|nr:MAG: hypothetical protein AUK17_01055 [Parcubacteria group bacterium CG2_30_44_18]PIQ74572.1 MAG: hypothetical protein COV85_01495 [Candidatus Portnoybacteria bacterium CG11_big_fil_rev_8_21_14_0_20_44_10]PIS16307.1 MAG: hypothetical protein COT61_04695 [Candidatus Portnoybacteria bacterium CG09_land_8_20_14_0_10_44_13]PIZ69750.1 MAG: hypothetical protein COY11_03995 [Candidatus Portnoybacteria bacterium CG_4_10_14_0_2_um_filter_44_20]PJA63291.1 MAG: hypothetical protein CO161_01905 [Candida